MNQTEGRASGEVPESQPSGPDLATRIAKSLASRRYTNVAMAPVAETIRESLAPIQEALEETVKRTWNDQPVGTKLSVLHDGIARALRLLRGEELSGNRGIDGGK